MDICVHSVILLIFFFNVRVMDFTILIKFFNLNDFKRGKEKGLWKTLLGLTQY